MDKKLFNMLVCPKTKAPLKYDKKNNELISEKGNIAYPIKDGIPVLLIEEARKIKIY